MLFDIQMGSVRCVDHYLWMQAVAVAAQAVAVAQSCQRPIAHPVHQLLSLCLVSSIHLQQLSIAVDHSRDVLLSRSDTLLSLPLPLPFNLARARRTCSVRSYLPMSAIQYPDESCMLC